MTNPSIDEKINIALVGYGRLARHLVPALVASGVKIKQWCVRNRRLHQEIYLQYGVSAVAHPSELRDNSDVILLLVSDDAISEVATQLNTPTSIVFHTSGMSSIDILPQKHAGIFYPLNTFNGKQPDWYRDTPIFIHAKDEKSLRTAQIMAAGISDQVHTIAPQDLQVVHLGAVISQNFSNHLIAQAEHILSAHELDRQLIHPLLSTMIRNLVDSPARGNQTGPAVRRDRNTINKQLALLVENEHLKDIYKKLSESIEKDLFE